MELFTTEVEERGAWTVVRARGQLDVATAPELHQLLVGIQVGQGTAVVLDLDGVEFVDDLGLGTLLGGIKRARQSDGRFVVVATRPRLVELLELTGLAQLLERADDVGRVVDVAS